MQGGRSVARAIRRAKKAAVSPVDAVAAEAEELARRRFDIEIDGRNFVTVIDGRYAVDVAAIYVVKLGE